VTHRRWPILCIVCRYLVFGATIFFIATTSHAKGIVYQAGELAIELSDNVEEAIHNGIPLTFICEYAIPEERLLVRWKRRYASHQFLVTHHALTNSYLVTNRPEAAPKIFRSVNEAMGFVAQQAQTFFRRYHSQKSGYHMRVRLSKTELPSPIRFNAFIAKDWDLNTGWKSWQSAQ